jgi:peptidoglycan/xylan/chitin deacetylase (PgdA/CDA1 family)
MWLLRAFGVRGMSMSQALPFLRGERHGRVAIITFDDGYADTLENALPVLKKHGFSATCYAVSGRLGGYNEWDVRELNVAKPLMDADQLRAWHASGMDVGAHTRTHVRLPSCDDAQLQDEVGGCRRELEAVIDAPVQQFCYPWGDHDDRVIASVRRAGFVTAVTTRGGRARPGDDLFRLRRIALTGANLPHLVALKLFTGYVERRG